MSPVRSGPAQLSLPSPSRLKRIWFTLALLVALGWLGDQLAHRPPAWLWEDPLLHPLGHGLSATDSAATRGADEGGERLGSVEFPLDINRSTKLELTALPRIGPVIAGRIVAHRDSLGGLDSLAQLRAIRGIGPATLERLGPLLRFAEADSMRH